MVPTDLEDRKTPQRLKSIGIWDPYFLTKHEQPILLLDEIAYPSLESVEQIEKINPMESLNKL